MCLVMIIQFLGEIPFPLLRKVTAIPSVFQSTEGMGMLFAKVTKKFDITLIYLKNVPGILRLHPIKD